MTYERRELSELQKRFITSVWSAHEEKLKPLRKAARAKLEWSISGLDPVEQKAILDAWDEMDEAAYAEYAEAGEALYIHALRLGVAVTASHAAELQEQEKEDPLIWKRLLASLGNPAMLDQLAGQWVLQQHRVLGAVGLMGEVLDE